MHNRHPGIQTIIGKLISFRDHKGAYLAVLFGAVAALIGVAGLADVTGVAAPLPWFGGMPAAIAAAVIVCAGVLLLAALGPRSSRVETVRVVMATAVALIGLAALAASVLVPHARGNGSWLLAATGLDGIAAPTAAALIVLAAAAFFQQDRRAAWPVVLLGTATAVIALLTIIGHWHGLAALHSPLGEPSMEVPTAAAIVLLSLGVVAMAPNRGPASIPRGPTLSGPAPAVFGFGRSGLRQDIAHRALNAAALGIIIAERTVTSGDAPIVYTNQAFSVISGYAPDEVRGRPLHFFAIESTGDSDAIARIALTLRDGEHRTVLFQAMRKDHSPFSCRMTVSTVPGSGRCGDHCIALLEDVTAERRAAEATERARNRMLASITHDLRSPLAASLMWTDVIQLSPLSEKAAKAVEAIRRNLKAQARLVSGLTDTAKLASGDLDLHMESGDLETLIVQSMPTWRSIAEEADVDLVCAITPGDYRLVMDVERVDKALQDLICFAVHAAPASSRVGLTVSSGESSVLAQINAPRGALSDTDIDQAFTLCRDSGDVNAEERQHPGGHPALSVARYVASRHGGSLTASSEGPDSALAFRFSIPRPSSVEADHRGTRKQALP